MVSKVQHHHPLFSFLDGSVQYNKSERECQESEAVKHGKIYEAAITEEEYVTKLRDSNYTNNIYNTMWHQKYIHDTTDTVWFLWQNHKGFNKVESFFF